MTETRPPASAPPPEGDAVVAREGLTTTADHKRLGLAYLSIAVALLAVGGLLLLVTLAAQAGLGLELPDAQLARLASAASTVSFVLAVPGLWIGLGGHVVPLQIGASGLAVARVYALSFWAYLSGAVVTCASYLFGDPGGAGLVASVPPETPADGARIATELWLAGLAVVAVATILASISLFATVVTARTEGMTLLRIPAFSASILATSAVWLLAAPAFVAGLFVLYLDQHLGGELFANSGYAGLKIWQHLLYLPGRPEVLLVAVPAFGALTDAVTTVARRALVPVAMAGGALLGGAAVLSVLVWAAGLDRLTSPLQPTPTVPSAAVVAPVGLLVLLWLGTLKQGRVRPNVSLAFVAGVLGLFALALLNGALGLLLGVEVGHESVFADAQLLVIAYGIPVLGLLGGVHHFGPKLWGRFPNQGLGGLSFLGIFGGVVVIAGAGWISGYTGGDLSGLAVAGAVLLVLGLLAAVGTFATAPKGKVAPADPYEGLTLEWHTSSPPPPHNFETLPEVRSATPLADLRGDAEGAAR